MSDVNSHASADYEKDDSLTPEFALYFFIVKCAAWWSLLLFSCAYAFLRRKIVSRAWFVFTALLFVICCNGIESSAYVGYGIHQKQKDHKTSTFVAYLLFRFFFNISRSMFLAVLLVIASGYCITRSDLGPHKQHVVFVPTAVLVTGLITDFAFATLASSPSADTYVLSQMDTVIASIWFVCAIFNLAALILAWLYLFEALSRELASLEVEYQKRSGQASGEQGSANPFTDAYAPLGSGQGKMQPSVQPVTASTADPEAAEGDCQTVADHLAYSAKKKLLSRFSLGVSSYLIAEISVILLPVFIINILQSTLTVLQFVVYFIFMVVLLVIFRPQEQSSYLIIGFSEEDAEERGVNHLLTGIDMETELLTAPNGGLGGTSTPSAAGPSASGGLGPSSAPPPPSRASRKAEVDSERYRQIPSAPTSSVVTPIVNQFTALPASARGLGTGSGSGSAAGGAGALPTATRGPKRGPQPRSRPPTTQPSADAGQFTLCSDDEGGDDASHPLTGGRGKGSH